MRVAGLTVDLLEGRRVRLLPRAGTAEELDHLFRTVVGNGRSGSGRWWDCLQDLHRRGIHRSESDDVRRERQWRRGTMAASPFSRGLHTFARTHQSTATFHAD